MKKKLNALAKLLAVSLSVGIASACSHVKVQDKEVCADLGNAGAACAHTHITKRRDLTKRQWDAERVGWLCMRGDDFSDSEDAVDQLCRSTNLCDYQTKAEIHNAKVRLRPIVRKAVKVRSEAHYYGEVESDFRK